MKNKGRAKKRVKQGIWGKLWAWMAVFSVVLVGIALAPHVGQNPAIPCANSVSCINDLTGAFEPGKQNIFMGHPVGLPPYIVQMRDALGVLGATSGVKHIFVDLTHQSLTAYEGSRLVMTFPVSTGKWRITPTGDYHIWIKLRYAHMEGGDKDAGTYYNLYNVPYVMFFYNDQIPKESGFSLHGAYWHDNFGHPMSHGCVNIRPEDARELYIWADPPTSGDTTYASDTSPGTLVTIYGQTPEE